MQTGALTSYIDVAQLALYAFWIFFAGLVYYLHRENKREGYPLIAERSNRAPILKEGIPPVPPPKTFLMHDGSTVMVPRAEARQPVHAVPAGKFPGAPLVPVGDPLLSGIGPGAYAQRADTTEMSYDDQKPKIVPLRAAIAFFLAWEDQDLRGYTVLGVDGVEAGKVVDVWIDRSEVVIRYIEVELTLPGAAHRVLLPINFAELRAKQRIVRTGFIRGAQFAAVPTTKEAETVTTLEEDKILAFYGGGMLYAMPSRAEALL